MAKKNKSNKSNINHKQTVRGHNIPTARRSLQRVYIPIDKTVIEDRRHYHPLRQHRPMLTTSAAPVKVQHRVSAAPKLYHTRHIPKRALVCVRRRERREVLFARRQTFKGGQSRRRNFTLKSTYFCS